MTGDLIGIALAAVAVLVGAVLLANELVLMFRYDDDGPSLRDRLHHGRHARGWVQLARARTALLGWFGPALVLYQGGEIISG